MKKIFLITIFIAFSMNVFSQKQTFDVVSFTIPQGWQQQQNEGGIQLSVTDNKTGSYAMAVITKAIASDLSANENFTNQWASLVKTTVQVNDEPVMQEPANENGWDIISGGANYTDGAITGIATLLTATGGGQTVSVVLMTNAKQYQDELLAFINSLELTKLPQKENSTIATSGSNTSIVGLWTYYVLETTGYYVNGFAQYTAGYYRSEYLFKADGTYIFRTKNWSVNIADILFIYETGSWKINGNQLTITPTKGSGEWWSKASSNKTNEWGARKKASDYKPETTTYTFNFHYYKGSNDTTLLLEDNKKYQRTYTLRTFDKSLIDNPPGLKMGSENKIAAANATTTNISNSPLTGKLWEGTSSEKFIGAGTSTGYNTGGFSTSQYKFNTDGTYRFVNVLASHYTNSKTLGYETGTWSANGNQLAINPAKGQNEEWSKTGKTSNGNSDVTNHAINETWNKKLKTSPRKLEKYNYTFNIGKNGDKTALILQRNGKTEREGEGNISYLNETSPGKSVKLPIAIN